MTGIPRKQIEADRSRSKQIEADRSTLWCRQDKALRIQVGLSLAAQDRMRPPYTVVPEITNLDVRANVL